jgi:hypothetical protein
MDDIQFLKLLAFLNTNDEQSLKAEDMSKIFLTPFT